MTHDPIVDLIQRVDALRIRDDLFYLSKDPLPFRKANYPVPGRSTHTLDEADAFIKSRLESWGYTVEKEACQAQASRSRTSRIKSLMQSAPGCVERDPASYFQR